MKQLIENVKINIYNIMSKQNQLLNPSEQSNTLQYGSRFEQVKDIIIYLLQKVR